MAFGEAVNAGAGMVVNTRSDGPIRSPWGILFRVTVHFRFMFTFRDPVWDFGAANNYLEQVDILMTPSLAVNVTPRCKHDDLFKIAASA